MGGMGVSLHKPTETPTATVPKNLIDRTGDGGLKCRVTGYRAEAQPPRRQGEPVDEGALFVIKNKKDQPLFSCIGMSEAEAVLYLMLLSFNEGREHMAATIRAKLDNPMLSHGKLE